MATNKAYITAGLPTPRDGTYATGTNKAFITAGLIPESVSADGWLGKLLDLSVEKINDLVVADVLN